MSGAWRRRARVVAGDLAAIEHDRAHLSLISADLNATTNQARVQRVVVGVDPQIRIG
jgi:F0F1-type ATP synthase membrane subunit b/b'